MGKIQILQDFSNVSWKTSHKCFLKSFYCVFKCSVVTIVVTLCQSDDVYLEAQIQNITASPIYLERVSLEPSSKYNVSPLNTRPAAMNSSDSATDDVLVVSLSLTVCGYPKFGSDSDISEPSKNLTSAQMVFRQKLCAIRSSN